MNEDFEYPKDYDVYWEKWVDAYEQELEEEASIIEQLKSMDLEFSEEEEIILPAINKLKKKKLTLMEQFLLILFF